MDIFGEGMAVIAANNFNFSAVKPEKLGASEYTLVTFAQDLSSSLCGFEDDLLKLKVTAVEACRKNPRIDNLMLRNITFNSQVVEEHGFAELATIDPSRFTRPTCGGRTLLYDATLNAIEATNIYAAQLAAQEFFVNGIVIIGTDGEDYGSTTTTNEIKRAIERGIKSEALESLMVILVGLNPSSCSASLQRFKNEAGLTQYEEVTSLTPATLAKLAKFYSQSISSQSQSLGTGGPSQPITF